MDTITVLKDRWKKANSMEEKRKRLQNSSTNVDLAYEINDDTIRVGSEKKKTNLDFQYGGESRNKKNNVTFDYPTQKLHRNPANRKQDQYKVSLKALRPMAFSVDFTSDSTSYLTFKNKIDK